MTRYFLAALSILAASPAAAQIVNPVADPALKADVTDAKRKADDAAAAAAVAAAQAATACQPGATTPPAEAIGGWAGSGSACRLANSVQPRITRAAIVATNASGTAAVTWPAMPAVPVVLPIAILPTSTSQPIDCFPIAGTITTTGASIKCYTAQTVTVSILGAVVAPFTTAAAGVSVQVVAIPTS